MKIDGLLAEAAGRIGAIPKTEQNKEQHFQFRSIDAIVAAAKPVFADLGIAVIPEVKWGPEYEQVQSSRGTRGWRCTVVMGYTFACDEDERFVSMAGEAVDYGDKSTTKAAQMAYKYALTQVLGVGGQEDPDAESPEVVAEEPRVGPGDWLATAVQAFKEWDEEERRVAYKTAMEALEYERLSSMERAQAVFESMAEMYYSTHPDDEGAPF